MRRIKFFFSLQCRQTVYNVTKGSGQCYIHGVSCQEHTTPLCMWSAVLFSSTSGCMLNPLRVRSGFSHDDFLRNHRDKPLQTRKGLRGYLEQCGKPKAERNTPLSEDLAGERNEDHKTKNKMMTSRRTTSRTPIAHHCRRSFDMCMTLAIFFIVWSIRVSVWSMSCLKSSSIAF